MSERLLDAFRDEAERCTPLPAFEPLEAAGRRRRRRRHAAVGVVAACTLAAAGFLAAPDNDSGEPRPADDSERSSFVTPYPIYEMVTLQAGTYEVTPAPGSSFPVVRFSVPPGWNAGYSPERFEGLDEVATYDAEVNKALLAQDPDWYVTVLGLDVRWVAQRQCSDVDVTDAASLVRALTNVPGLEVTAGPEDTVRFGHPAVHLRLRDQDRQPPSCRRETILRDARGNYLAHFERGTTYDIWVTDLDGRPAMFAALWTRGTPHAEVDAALGILDSVELLDPE
jgi:hypothetical protein